MGKLREECGVFGIYAAENADLTPAVYAGLFALQHRGQESCGIVVNDDGVFTADKDVGLVGEVFTEARLAALGRGNMAVGHVRYGTTGSGGVRNAQPIVVDHIKGHMALAHNGNLVNSYELRSELELAGSIFHTTSDTEVIAYIITKERITSPSIEEALASAMYRMDGAYSLVLMSPSKLLAVRDPHGFRPLCYGRRQDGSYVVASESCALDAVGQNSYATLSRGNTYLRWRRAALRQRHCGSSGSRSASLNLFISPDPIRDQRLLRTLRAHTRGRAALQEASGRSRRSNRRARLRYRRGIGYAKPPHTVRRRTQQKPICGQTFILPGQSSREDKVRIKFKPVSSAVCGKRIVLVDDTIVRGTTSERIVKLLRNAGAREIHMHIAAPPFRHPCYYGTDIDSADNLIANHFTVEQIRDKLGVDSLGYLEQSDAESLCGDLTGFCSACFSGNYPTQIPSNAGKNRFEYRISDRMA
jgi:amidophosphoribosyltransferase